MSSDSADLSRRQVLAVLGTGAVLSTAGCSGDSADDEDDTSTPEDDEESTEPTDDNATPETQSPRIVSTDAELRDNGMDLSVSMTVEDDTGLADAAIVVGDHAIEDDLDGTEATLDPVLSSPTVVNGTVYVGSRDDNMYALDTQQGHKRWAYETGGEIICSPAVVDDTIYVGSYDHNVCALDAQQGHKRSAHQTGGRVYRRSRPSASGSYGNRRFP